MTGVIKTVAFLSVLLFFNACGVGSTSLNGTGECFGYDNPADSDYVLPYMPGDRFKVTQGNCNEKSHSGRARYAYDFNLPLEWMITATRGGVVTDIMEARGTNDENNPNWIEITHSDGTVSRYQYLCQNCADRELGEQVFQGDQIARSGRLLHFETFRFVNGTRESLPVTFRNTTDHPNGLIQGEEYTAEEFDPAN